MARIFKDRIYLLWDYRGMSGFRDFDSKQYAIATGAKAKTSGWRIEGEYSPSRDDRFTNSLGGFGKVEFFDGEEAVDHLRRNPWDMLYQAED